jgi:hypothetical protein
MQAYLPRKYFTKWFILNKVCISKTMIENEFQDVIKVLPLISKDYFSNHISIFALCK